MNPEISRLAALYFTETQLPLSQRLELIPFVENAKSLKDIPEPWRSQMQEIKTRRTSATPHEKPDTQGTITEHSEEN